jgi:succinate dehydrogenase flavin-adding protein (antitoxin of CptAB toxin-antitoxin module)
MKELDLLLEGWVQHQFDRASLDQRLQFEALLALPDPDLVRYLLGGERPPAQGLACAVDAVLTNVGIMSSGSPEPSRVAPLQHRLGLPNAFRCG